MLFGSQASAPCIIPQEFEAQEEKAYPALLSYLDFLIPSPTVILFDYTQWGNEFLKFPFRFLSFYCFDQGYEAKKEKV